MKQPTLTIVIPCLNEKGTIRRSINDALTQAKKYFPNSFQVIVADNGSTDGSLKIIKSFGRRVTLVNVPVRGYGAALHWGILKAKGKYVCFADADLSYPFSNLKKFKPLLKNKPDLLLGSRLRGNIQQGAMPPLHRYLGTPILTLLIRLIYQIPTSDCNSGMRIIKKSFYKKLNMRNSGMEWASELLLKTALKKGNYQEVPIDFRKDKRNRKPHLSTWSDGWRHLKAIILLKPVLLELSIFLFLLLAIFVYHISFALTTLFILLSVVSFFSWLALKFLAFAIESVPNLISNQLNSNLLVPLVLLFTLLNFAVILLLSDKHLGSKMILISINSIIFIWVFLVETIKTHLINRLPDLQS